MHRDVSDQKLSGQFLLNTKKEQRHFYETPNLSEPDNNLYYSKSVGTFENWQVYKQTLNKEGILPH